MSPVVATVIDLVVVAVTAYGYRLWLVVAQQEHYVPGRLVAVMRVWLRAVPLTVVQAVLVVLLALGGLTATYTAIVAAVIGLFATPGFDKGWGAAPLDWTPRLRRLAATVLLVHVVVGLALGLLGAISLLPLLTLPIAEVALLALRPLEARRGGAAEVTEPGGTNLEGRVRPDDGGPVVIDAPADAGPVGARRALAQAQDLTGPGGTTWTVSAGLFDLGPARVEENVELGRAATDGERMRLCVVGRTNSKELRTGGVDTTGDIETFTSQAGALAHVLPLAGPGDVVLLLGDLPVHYP